MKQRVTDEAMMKTWAQTIGALLQGGEVFELVGDVGAGKTTFTKGLAQGLGVNDVVQSPSFTISRQYEGERGLRLAHYDFYRLDDAGIMADELGEVYREAQTVTVVEWADAVQHVLPDDRLQLIFRPLDEHSREVEVKPCGQRSQKLMEQLG